MEKPEWDVESPKGRREMAEWIDFMLDRDLDVRFEKLQTDSMTNDNIAGVMDFWSENDGLHLLVGRLLSGTASVKDQQRAAKLLSPLPKKRGPKFKGKEGRYWWLVAAAEDNERIKSLWAEHYGERYRVNKLSADFAANRWGADGKWVYDNARRSKDRKFAAD